MTITDLHARIARREGGKVKQRKMILNRPVTLLKINAMCMVTSIPVWKECLMLTRSRKGRFSIHMCSKEPHKNRASGTIMLDVYISRDGEGNQHHKKVGTRHESCYFFSSFFLRHSARPLTVTLHQSQQTKSNRSEWTKSPSVHGRFMTLECLGW